MSQPGHPARSVARGHRAAALCPQLRSRELRSAQLAHLCWPDILRGAIKQQLKVRVFTTRELRIPESPMRGALRCARTHHTQPVQHPVVERATLGRALRFLGRSASAPAAGGVVTAGGFVLISSTRDISGNFCVGVAKNTKTRTAFVRGLFAVPSTQCVGRQI